MTLDDIKDLLWGTPIIYIDDAGREQRAEFVRYMPEMKYCKAFIHGDRGLTAIYINPEDIRRTTQ